MKSVCSKMRGFTLVEMAVVLVIMGLVIGGLTVPLTTQMKIRDVSSTQKQFDEIKAALIGFAIVNGRLPRPATSTSDGSELSANCASETACTGYIPWATLGLPKLDGWGKIIEYSVTPAYSNSSTLISLTPTVATKTIQTRDDLSGSLVYIAGYASCTTTTNCVPAVIYSSGEKNYGTKNDGTVLVDCSSCTNTDEDTNSAATVNFIQRNSTSNDSASGGQFDDMVDWISVNVLLGRMVAAGKLP